MSAERKASSAFAGEEPSTKFVSWLFRVYRDCHHAGEHASDGRRGAGLVCADAGGHGPYVHPDVPRIMVMHAQRPAAARDYTGIEAPFTRPAPGLARYT
jgi:hypothetical protein